MDVVLVELILNLEVKNKNKIFLQFLTSLKRKKAFF